MPYHFPGEIVPALTQWQGVVLITAILVAHHLLRRVRRR